jgi:hypothetical protein
MNREFIQRILHIHQQYGNNESKWERHRSTFDLVSRFADIDYLQWIRRWDWVLSTEFRFEYCRDSVSRFLL